ncbi:glycoside hydrolase family 13 protein [Planctomyces sp. SH-PL62]|uniref:glycoside hydrolase family 13 protein n=1 Tax=Planctomyces sp. SH-PL62 TaxID=1636152 RepID=UPI00078B9D51|nr:glycoside hydrolase family 13 protein [Planctomyces sp. SH-PL62]AMV40036.1 Neopullulanase [Planctomyces sp. SH-PL62]
MERPDTPDWVRDAVFYQIFPDRFARSLSVPKSPNLEAWGSPPTYNGYQGGDLVGVAERLDYLQELGVNAIYFTPVFQSASNHRYHTHDYEKVDPMLGGDAALRRLLDAAHERGMKVVLDGVFNHASRGFFPFHDILENGPDSAYVDWFKVSGFPVNAYHLEVSPNYEAWWNLPALPKFNIQNPEVREYLFNVAVKWIEFGIDGWRLDVANEIEDDEFWREFRRRVRRANPEAYIVGEVWTDAQRWLHGDMWDAVMNYHFTRACLAFFTRGEVDLPELQRTSLHPIPEPGAESFARSIERLHGIYAPETTAAMLNLLGSHDMARFVTLARGDVSALRLATLFQMTYLGAPSIYYGDEIGLSGGHDPANRGAFPWDQPAAWNRDLLHEFQRLTALRRSRPSLRRGSFRVLHADGDVFAHARKLGEETVLVAFNAGTTPRRLDLPVHDQVADGVELADPWSHQAAVVESGLVRGLELPPRSGKVLATPLGS